MQSQARRGNCSFGARLSWQLEQFKELLVLKRAVMTTIRVTVKFSCGLSSFSCIVVALRIDNR
jgi:hypothetical protein